MRIKVSNDQAIRTALTDTIVRDLTPKDKAYTVCDYDCLYLVVHPSGVKSWVYRPRDGRGKKTLGRYPGMKLKDARRVRDELAEKHQRGEDEGVTVRELAFEWMKMKVLGTCTPGTIRLTQQRLDTYLLPKFGDRIMSEVTPVELLTLCRQIEAQGKIETAHRIKNLWGQIARYGIAAGGKCDRDVSQDLAGAMRPLRSEHHASIQDKKLLGALLRSMADNITPRLNRLLMFQAYTVVRPTEARCARWEEIDLTERLWRIPPERMKMKRPHLVPLSYQAMAILEAARPKESGLIFPSQETGEAMSDMTPLMALRRACTKAKLPPMVPHGWRSTASTLLNEYQWPADAIERQLAHVPGGVRAVYNYAQYLDTRRVMLQWWADFLDALRDGTSEPERPGA